MCVLVGQPLSPCSTEGVPGRALDCKASGVLCVRHGDEQLGGVICGCPTILRLAGVSKWGLYRWLPKDY